LFKHKIINKNLRKSNKSALTAYKKCEPNILKVEVIQIKILSLQLQIYKGYKKMIAKFQESFRATVPYKNRFAGKAQMPEVLCGVLRQDIHCSEAIEKSPYI
jgi:hypothetical protein